MQTYDDEAVKTLVGNVEAFRSNVKPGAGNRQVFLDGLRASGEAVVGAVARLARYDDEDLEGALATIERDVDSTYALLVRQTVSEVQAILASGTEQTSVFNLSRSFDRLIIDPYFAANNRRFIARFFYRLNDPDIEPYQFDHDASEAIAMAANTLELLSDTLHRAHKNGFPLNTQTLGDDIPARLRDAEKALHDLQSLLKEAGIE